MSTRSSQVSQRKLSSSQSNCRVSMVANSAWLLQKAAIATSRKAKKVVPFSLIDEIKISTRDTTSLNTAVDCTKAPASRPKFASADRLAERMLGVEDKAGQVTRRQKTKEFMEPLQKINESIRLVDDAVKERLQSPKPTQKVQITAAKPERLAHVPLKSCLKTFEEMNLPTWLLQSLSRQNISQPTPVQQRFVEAMLTRGEGKKERPILIKSQTGTGKSLGYVIAMLAKLHQQRQSRNIVPVWNCNHLVLVPNSILAQQLLRWIKLLVDESPYYSADLAKVVRLLLPEGEIDFFDDDLSQKELGQMGTSYILVATAGPAREALAKGQLNISNLESIIVDEADALLKPLKNYATLKEKLLRTRHPVPAMSLLKGIHSACRENRFLQPRLIFSSASLNNRCRDDLQESGLVSGAYTLIKDAVRALTCPSTIKHYYRMLADSEGIEELVQLIHWVWTAHEGELGVIFVPAARSKTSMKGWLESVGITTHIMSDLPTADQTSLQRIIKGEQQGKKESVLLLGSDADARGWDLPSLRYVIIVDLPSTPSHYLHMAGRVGRMGQSGSVYTLVAGSRDLERLTNIFSMLRVNATPYLPHEQQTSNKD